MDQDPATWHIHRKINTYLHNGWHEWGQYHEDNIAPARGVLAALPVAQTLEARNEQVRAIYQWLRGYATSTIEPHRHPDGSLNLRWHPEGAPAQWLIEGATEPATLLTGEQITGLGPIDADLLGQVEAAELDWFATAPEAPVAMAIFTPQETVGKNIQPIYEDDGSSLSWQWDATAALLGVEPRKRTAVMEPDTYESDALRDHADALDEAREWDGPYCIEALLYRPSDELIAHRQARLMEHATPTARAATHKPRI